MLSSKLNQIKNTLESIVLEPNEKVELEARFGKFTDERFTSEVIYPHFNRLLEHLTKLKGSTHDNIQITSEIDRDIRKNITDQEIIFQQKRDVRNGTINLSEYNLRISIKIESLIEEPDNFNPTLIRTKNRHSFWIYDGQIQVDLTEVTTHYLTSNVVKTHYEVEVERVSGDLSVFNSAVTSVFKWLKGTTLVYTKVMLNSLNRDIGNILSGPRTNYIRRNVLVNARNLKRADLAIGGIVGSKFGSYNVTYKADGLRKMLIIHKSGIWLVYPPTEFNLVADKQVVNDKILTALSGTVYDGELVEDLKRYTLINGKRAMHYFYIFDCLAFTNNLKKGSNPNSLKVELDFNKRRQYVDTALKYLRNGYIYVDTKKVLDFKTSEEYFKVVNEMLNGRKNLPYKDDGLIFTPVGIESPGKNLYNPGSDRHHLVSRQLKYHPDVCKWKPTGELTIDFAVKFTSEGIELLSWDHSIEPRGGYTQFKGDNINKFTPDMIEDSPLFDGIESETIVEFEWNSETKKLKPRKLRLFKSSANTIEVALDIWKNIFDPITEEILVDQSVTPVFKYHNSIKRQLFRQLEGVTSLLDLGSGRGGDSVSWSRINPEIKIVAVEPNRDNIKELESRLSQIKLENQVLIVNDKAESTQVISDAVKSFIPGGKVDAISLMLSLSFFWQDSNHLDSLVSTIIQNIKPGGRIIFLTIDGDTEEELLEPALHPELHKSHIDLNGVKIRLYPKGDPPVGRASNFIIPGENIVGDQHEYIVHLTDLMLRLQKYGFELDGPFRAYNSNFLIPDNIILSDLYSYGTFNHDGSQIQVKDIPDEDEQDLYKGVFANNVPKVKPEVSQSLTPEVPGEVITEDEVSQSLTPEVPGEVITEDEVSQSLTPEVPGEDVSEIKTRPPPIPAPRTLATKVVQQPILRPPEVKSERTDINEGGYLRWLPVYHLESNGFPINGPARGDDAVAPLKCSWCSENNLVRIATIGDGSCFIHALLKSFYSPYQENKNARVRIAIVNTVRRDLAANLTQENPEYPGFSYWETTGKGAFPRNAIQEAINDDLIDLIYNGIDFSRLGLSYLLNSIHTIGDELYSYISDVFNVNIYIIRATEDELHPHLIAINPNFNRQNVLILANGSHYEVIGTQDNDQIKTLFDSDSPVMNSVNQLFKGYSDLSDQFNVEPFNPIESFRSEVVTLISQPDYNLDIPSFRKLITSKVPEGDPLLNLYNKTFT